MFMEWIPWWWITVLSTCHPINKEHINSNNHQIKDNLICGIKIPALIKISLYSVTIINKDTYEVKHLEHTIGPCHLLHHLVFTHLKFLISFFHLSLSFHILIHHSSPNIFLSLFYSPLRNRSCRMVSLSSYTFLYSCRY